MRFVIRLLMRVGLIGLLWIASVGGAVAQPDPAAQERPNVVVVFVDDLGYGDIEPYGHPTIRTPHLRQLADEGVRLTDFYVVSSVCTPSRAALLTGRHPLRSGTMVEGAREVFFPDSREGLPPEEVTIAEALGQAGYATALVGKWHLGHQPGYLPTDQGFDSYFGILYSNDMNGRPGIADLAPGQPWYEVNKLAPPDSFDVPLVRSVAGELAREVERPAKQETLTPRYTAEAVDFITREAAAERPFFLFLAHSYPHIPLYASSRFAGRSAAGIYGDVVEELDWSVGEVLRALQEAGVDENTLVVFTSDNGPWLLYEDHGGSAGPLRGGKASAWEGGFRVPFLAQWPDRIPAGTVVRQPASALDLFPTLLALAGIDPDAGMPVSRQLDGRSMLSLLAGDSETFETGFEGGAFPYYVGGTLYALRQGPWKIHLVTRVPYTGEPAVRHDPPLLFHLGRDPGERYDVAAEHPEVVADLIELAARIDARIDRGRDVMSARAGD
ncbi:MAG: sulfatase [Rubricoccaceae bacterium]